MCRSLWLSCLLLPSLSAQSWVDRGVPDLTTAFQGPGAFDPVSGRLLVVDRQGSTWAAEPAGAGIAWTPLFDGELPARMPTNVVLGFDRGRGRLHASAFSPSGSYEWVGDGWQPAGSGLVPNRVAFDEVRGLLVGILDPYLGTATPVVERVAGTWTFRGLFAVPGRGPIAWDPVRGEVLMHGRDAGGVLRTHAWNGATWTPVATGTGPDTQAFALATDPVRGRVVAHGGMRAGVPVADTWEWDGGVWTWAGVGAVPPAMNRTIGYFDSLQRVVAYGGVVDTAGMVGLRDADMWTWDGAVWSVLPAATPGWRQGHALVHDPVRGETVLFGGRDANGVLQDTWIWNGVSWSQRSTALAPPARHGHVMVFDSRRGVVLLFGGTDDTVDLSDLWSWDGVTWTAVPTLTQPPPRAAAAAAYDAFRDRLVVFGGTTLGGGWRNDTQEWDGSTWWPRLPSTPPASLVRPLMAYDVARQRTVLVAGASGQTFEWDGDDYTGFGVASPFLTATAVWFDPMIGRVRSNLPSAVGGASSEWSQGAWLPSALANEPAGLIVHDVARGKPLSFDGRRTRLATDWLPTVDDAGAGCGAPAAVPTLAVHSVPALGQARFGFDLHAPTTGVTLAAMGAAAATATIPVGSGCTWWLANAIAGPLLVTSAEGFGSWTIAVPQDAALLGAVVYGQGVVLDALATNGIALTTARRVQLGE